MGGQGLQEYQHVGGRWTGFTRISLYQYVSGQGLEGYQHVCGQGSQGYQHVCGQGSQGYQHVCGQGFLFPYIMFPSWLIALLFWFHDQG